MRVAGIVLTGIAVLLFAWLALGSPYPIHEPPPWPWGVYGPAGPVEPAHLRVEEAPLDGPFVVVVDTPRGRRDAEAVRHALARVQSYLTGLGAPIRDRTEVHLAGRRCDGGPMDREDALGVASGHTICLYVTRPGFPHGPYLEEVAGHEAVHTMQTELGCNRRGRAVPQWLLEGMAMELPFRALTRVKEADPAGSLMKVLRRSGASPGGLRAYERSAPEGAYFDGLAAMLLLDAGRPRREVAFCAATGRGVPWRRAFADAFGVSPVAFYRRFDRLRAG